jgi:hypothetical protein
VASINLAKNGFFFFFFKFISYGLKLNALPNTGCVVLVVKLNAVLSLAATNTSVIKP